MPTSTETVELSIVMPCLNEAETLAVCIDKAQGYLERSGVVGEVIIADNGSTDGSQDIARAHGARVVDVPAKGYGSALMGGIEAARGEYVIMGDADDSYDFSKLEPFVERLRAGDELVMGNRFKGGIAEGAMPPLHKYLGNPVLSWIGRILFRSPIGDFHCGLRGFNRRVHPQPAPADHGHGVRERGGRQVDARRACASPRCRPRSTRTAAAGRRTCAAGATAGGTCGSC